MLGGTVGDLPYARRPSLPRGALRSIRSPGCSGWSRRPAEAKRFSERDVRRLLSQAIDRDALIAGLNDLGLAARHGTPGRARGHWLAASSRLGSHSPLSSAGKA